MAGIMIVKQRVADIARWKSVFDESKLDSIRRQHGLHVTGTYLAASEPSTVIVAMKMEDLTRELLRAVGHAGRGRDESWRGRCSGRHLVWREPRGMKAAKQQKVPEPLR